MVKGIQIAFAILVTFFLPEVIGKAYAQTAPKIIASNKITSCSLPSYVLVTRLKHGNLIQKNSQAIAFVAPIYTAPKPTNGAMTGSIGVEQISEQSIPKYTEQITQPSPTQAPISQQSQTTDTAGGLSSDKLFAMVNEHRVRNGLQPFQNDQQIAQVAKSRAPELQNEIYGGSYMHAGFQERNLPYWATENMISQQSEEEALQWWLNSGVHRAAIEGDDTYASVACEGKNCAMIFTSFAPKQATNL